MGEDNVSDQRNQGGGGVLGGERDITGGGLHIADGRHADVTAYRDGDANCWLRASDIDTHRHRNVDAAAHSDFHACSDCHRNVDAAAYGDAHSDPDANAAPDTDRHAHSNTHTHGHTYPSAHAHGDKGGVNQPSGVPSVPQRL